MWDSSSKLARLVAAKIEIVAESVKRMVSNLMAYQSEESEELSCGCFGRRWDFIDKFGRVQVDIRKLMYTFFFL